MRIQKINERTLYFAELVQSDIPMLDEWGNETGEHSKEYSEPKKIKANISPAKGTANMELFGKPDDYDKVIVVSGKAPFKEEDILWIDNLRDGKIPETNGIEIPHDYEIFRIAESLNFTSIAIKKVNLKR